MTGLFWATVYVGVLAAALLRRWRQSRVGYDLGDAGWRERPAACLPRGALLARAGVDVVRFGVEMVRDVVEFFDDFLDALTG
jgi:hypothetical protein